MLKREGIYIFNLIARLIFALFLTIFNNLFYSVLGPITLYGSYFLTSIFYEASLKGDILQVSGFDLKFIPACAAVSAYLLLVILILLTKDIGFKRGIAVLLIGALMIYAANLIRIEILIWLLVNKGLDYFKTLHLFFWKVLASIYVAFVWVFLTRLFKIKEIPLYSDLKYLLLNLKKKY